MERTLSLIIDDEAKLNLTLFSGTCQEIDEYTMKNFVNSEEIRKKYAKEIEPFLSANQAYIAASEKATGRKNRGKIVLLESVQKGTEHYLIQQRVLYKSAPHVAKEAIKSRKVMQVVACIDSNGKINPGLYNRLNIFQNKGKYRLSRFVNELISKSNYPTQTNLRNVRQWLKYSEETYYEKIRLLVTSYSHARRLYPGLKTPERIYSEYLESRKRPVFEPVEEEPISPFISINDETFVDIDGVKYPIDQVPFDHDELLRMGVDPIFDGMKKHDR